MSEFIKNLDVTEVVSPVKHVDFTLLLQKLLKLKEVQHSQKQLKGRATASFLLIYRF
jgi:hypothetical protein